MPKSRLASEINMCVAVLFVGKKMEVLILMIFTYSKKALMSPLVTVRLRTKSSNTKTTPPIPMGIMINK